MADDAKRRDRQDPANDNPAPDGQENGCKTDASAKLDAAVISIARLIGRQMARDDFAALQAANDNRNRRAVDDD
ncbi:hypothetical protein G6L67_04250 [Agrobacterium tumefaciens]|uniref:Uncharacterized protein n=1 Tax=Agrobacterium tumefaciens str. Kerr 14 TaxID=1183424 RepID=A0A1S7Q3Z2_AGRTU|nr:hypothetical protein [Agrobacterium tumefaciens]AYM80358.1 hypothetical protein At12D1_04710 [Agrobacterium tumefaciens]NTE91058.1 hypothetical protein [Agrobacterium tumefaciens]CUX30694.1 conserved hypothetical protein [Agrobacterium tumefaciens str. Kerr 14]